VNGKIDYLGNGWGCQRGFYKPGNKCLKVKIPKNGKLNYLGNGWDCKRGFYKSGNQCFTVKFPKYGKLKHNNRMHSDSKKLRSFLARFFAAGDARCCALKTIE